MKTISSIIILCTIPLLVVSFSTLHRSTSLGPNQGNCLGSERNRKCTEKSSVLSCVCFKNGTCYSDYVDRCVECNNKKVKSVNEGCCAANTGAPPSIDGICSQDDRDRKCFAYLPVESCICYTNGTCVNGKADRCGDCAPKDVYSINKGKCSQKSLAHAKDICQSGERGVRCFAFLPALSCVCYGNGVCKTEETDRCSACGNPDVVAITKGCCPAPPVETCRKTSLDQCPVIDGRLVKCANIYNEGCICYKNGTCIEGPVNNCIQCQQDDVFGVEVGSKCPCKGVFEATCIKKKIDSCPVYPPNVAVDCARTTAPGCVCYNNGTCVEKDMNTCMECQYTENVVAAQQGTKCPCPGYQKI